MIIRYIFSIFLTLVTLADPAARANKKDTLVLGISQEYDSLHPHIMAMAAARYLQYMVNRPLVILDADSKWVPMLAEAIPTLKQVKEKKENGKLKNVVIWNIRPKANWSDGNPITCADFAYSLEVGKDSLVQVANKEVYDRIERIEFDISKPKSCRFTYSNNSWNYYQVPDFFPLPAHVDRPIFTANKTEKGGYSNKNIYSVGTATTAPYSGPFKVSEVKPGSHIILEKNQNFFGHSAYFSKVIVKIIPNSNTYESYIKSGTLDMIVPIGITFDQALDFNKRWALEKNSEHRVIFREGANFEHLTFSMDSPVFKDIKVRQALVQSINREELSRTFFENKQSIANFYQSKTCPWYPNDISKIKTYKYSVKDAEKLLDSAGWTTKEDGFRHRDGKKLSFQFSTTSGNAIRENVQIYIKNEWKKIGVDVMIKNYPARVLFGEVAKKRQFDGVIMHAWSAAPETAPVGFLASKNIPSESNNWSGFNFGGWASPNWDKALENLLSAKSQEKRKSLIVEMLNIYNTEIPDIPLFYKTEVAVIPKIMKNFKISGHLYPESNQIEKWQY